MVLDARDPEGTRISEIEDYAQKNSKKVIMLLNKSDLAPNTTEWQAYFKQKGIISMVYQANEALKKEGDEETEDLSGSEKLQTLLFKYSKKFAEKKDLEQLCVAVVGYPNTGKSSAINLLVNRHVCNTGSSPFITKAIKQISLNRQVIVLDTPAVMKSNVSDNIRSAMQVDDIIDPIKAVEQLFDKVEKSEFLRFYRIGAFKTAEELSEQVAKKKGMVDQQKKFDAGGKKKKQEKAQIETIVNKEMGARRILRDFLNNRLMYFSKIPGQNSGDAEESMSD